MDRFLPKGVRREKAREFKDLKQFPSITMVEYDVCFTQLSWYTPYLVPIERVRIKRFIDRLMRPLYKVVTP